MSLIGSDVALMSFQHTLSVAVDELIAFKMLL